MWIAWTEFATHRLCMHGICIFEWDFEGDQNSKAHTTWLKLTLQPDHYRLLCQLDRRCNAYQKYQIEISATWNCECTKCVYTITPHTITRFNSMIPNNAAAVYHKKNEKTRQGKNTVWKSLVKDQKFFFGVHFSCFSLVFFLEHCKEIGGT